MTIAERISRLPDVRTFKPVDPRMSIYIITDGANVLYVGKTSRLTLRIKHHERVLWERHQIRLDYDHIYVFDVAANDAVKVERAVIKLLEPTLNVMRPARFVSVFAKMLKRYGIPSSLSKKPITIQAGDNAGRRIVRAERQTAKEAA